MGRTIKTESFYVFSTLPRLGQSEKVLRAQSICKLYRIKTHNSQQYTNKNLQNFFLLSLFFRLTLLFDINKISSTAIILY